MAEWSVVSITTTTTLRRWTGWCRFWTARARIDMARRLVQADTLREASHRQLMEAYLAIGEKAQALRHYDKLSKLLRDDLGVEPSPETQELRNRIAANGNGVAALAAVPLVSYRAASAAIRHSAGDGGQANCPSAAQTLLWARGCRGPFGDLDWRLDVHAASTRTSDSYHQSRSCPSKACPQAWRTRVSPRASPSTRSPTCRATRTSA